MSARITADNYTVMDMASTFKVDGRTWTQALDAAIDDHRKLGDIQTAINGSVWYDSPQDLIDAIYEILRS